MVGIEDAVFPDLVSYGAFFPWSYLLGFCSTAYAMGLGERTKKPLMWD